MKRITKLLAVALCLVCVLSFAACGPNNKPSGNDGLPSIDNPWWNDVGTVEKDSNGKPIFHDVSIKLTSVVCGNDQNGFEALIDEFEAEYDNQITITHQVYNQLVIDETVRTQIQNETVAPDLILTHQKTHAQFAAEKLIQPMDAAYQLAGIEVDKSNFLPNFAEYCDLGYEGRMFTVPVDAQSMVVYYNKNILKKYNKELPSNRQEFIDLCKYIQKEEKKSNGQFQAITCGITDSEWPSMYLLPTAIVQNGGEFYGSDGKVHWDEGANLTAFQNGVKAIQGIANEGIWNFNESTEASRSRFCNDNALFYISLPFDANVIFSAYSQRSGHSVETVKTQDIGGFSTSGLFAMDGAPEEAKTKIFGDSHAFMMSKTVEDVQKKAAIATFVNWFTSKVNVGIEWAKLGHTSASYLIRGDAAYNADSYVADFNNMFYTDVNNFVTAGKNKHYSLIFSDLQTTLLNLVTNTTNDTEIKNELQRVKRKINAAIDLANLG